MREAILDKVRNQCSERKTQDAKQKAKRYLLDFTERAARAARAKKSRQQRAQGSARLVVPKSARADRTGVLGREGSWKRTADESARLCQQDGPSHLPPCYAGLHQEHQRRLTSEMCGCLEEVQWATCVVCWRAWYDLPGDYEFSYKQQGLRLAQTPWFDPSASVVTRARKRGVLNQWRLEAAGSVEEAQRYLAANYSAEECETIASRLHNPEKYGHNDMWRLLYARRRGPCSPGSCGGDAHV